MNQATRNLRSGCAAGLAMALALAASSASADTTYSSLWARQPGTIADEDVWGAAVDGNGNSFLAGSTKGSLGATNAGNDDVFLNKYTTAGTLAWSRQVGSTSVDAGTHVGVDASGNSYVAGYTYGTLPGSSGTGQLFLAKYSAGGAVAWVRQLGSTGADAVFGIAVDGAGNAYLAGRTDGALPSGGGQLGGTDAFVVKYDTSGTQQWARQFGTSNIDGAEGVSVDSHGNVLVSGYTGGAMVYPPNNGVDAFVRKYDASGNVQWTRQIGSVGADHGRAVGADSAGNVYLAGVTDLGLANTDLNNDGGTFLVKYDAAGGQQWVRELNAYSDDVVYGMSVDGTGDAMITGTDLSTVAGNYGYHAIFTRYDASGNLLFADSLGTAGLDEGRAVVQSADGSTAWLAGTTTGSWGGPNAGGYDAYLAAISLPEPASLPVLLAAMLAGVAARRVRRPVC